MCFFVRCIGRVLRALCACSARCARGIALVVATGVLVGARVNVTRALYDGDVAGGAQALAIAATLIAVLAVLGGRRALVLVVALAVAFSASVLGARVAARVAGTAYAASVDNVTRFTRAVRAPHSQAVAP